MFSKKNGVYSVTFHAQGTVKEPYTKSRILFKGILLANELSPRGIESSPLNSFLCYNNLEGDFNNNTKKDRNNPISLS
jgi:hypothetical protein